MKKNIITIERQYGSGGSVIGKLAAEKLGINCYNRQILEMTAAKCGISPEYLDAFTTVTTLDTMIYSPLLKS